MGKSPSNTASKKESQLLCHTENNLNSPSTGNVIEPNMCELLHLKGQWLRYFHNMLFYTEKKIAFHWTRKSDLYVLTNHSEIDYSVDVWTFEKKPRICYLTNEIFLSKTIFSI